MENKQVILTNTEEFKFEKLNEEGKEKIIISGQAMPLKEMSRNGVFYRDESVKKAYKSLEGCAFLFNHDTNQPKGHVVFTDMQESGILYKADIDPEEKDFIRKVERGDIRHVSVGCMVENPEFNESDGTVTVDVKEFVELSSVPVPGFKNTSANKEGAMFLAESFGNKEFLEKLKIESEEEPGKKKKDGTGPNPDCDKKEKEPDEEEDPKKEEADEEDDEEPKDKEEASEPEDDKDMDKEKEEEEEPEEKPEDEKDKKEELKTEQEPTEDETTDEEKMQMLNSQVNDLFGKMDEMTNRLAILESKVDTMNESEEKVKEEVKLISPDTTETFKTDKILPKSKESQELKEELLSDSKKATKKEVDMSRTRLNNLSY